MPELPEVEVIRRGLAPRLLGRRLRSVKVGKKRLRQASPPQRLARWLPGRRLEGLQRRGKYLVFRLEGGVTLLIHLGMTGRLLLGASGGRASHVHLVFTFEGGVTLAFEDMRRFGQVLVFAPGEPLTPLEQVGRDPFSRRVTPAWLAEVSRTRRRPLKNFLLDGRLLAGLGNIYACEVMFAAGLHPATPAGALSLEEWDRVLQETRRILKRAIRQGGTTVNNYLDSRGETGLFQLELMVYGRAGEPCRRCGAAIQRLVQAGRSTFFCPRCQPEKGFSGCNF
ncbi:MAG: bifunctional DNA-formamidopyrimidine glycosylase/DNA-(apurinic or apyrimidinic site) lyase [Thermodesulfobacteriota bacterium]